MLLPPQDESRNMQDTVIANKNALSLSLFLSNSILLFAPEDLAALFRCLGIYALLQLSVIIF
jgi:hypothetical protein